MSESRVGILIASLYNGPSADPQFCRALKKFLLFADILPMKQFFQGLVLGVLLMYWYLNFGSVFLYGLYP
jgi:hypothetical protein